MLVWQTTSTHTKLQWKSLFLSFCKKLLYVTLSVCLSVCLLTIEIPYQAPSQLNCLLTLNIFARAGYTTHLCLSIGLLTLKNICDQRAPCTFVRLWNHLRNRLCVRNWFASRQSLVLAQFVQFNRSIKISLYFYQNIHLKDSINSINEWQ